MTLRSFVLVPALLRLVAGAALAVTAGTSAPDFAVADASGKTVKLSDYKGKFVVLEWTNPECPFVRAQYGAETMQALQKEAGAQGRRVAVDQLDQPVEQRVQDAARR